MKNSSVFDCSLVPLPKIYNRSGNITPLHGGDTIPFDIKRIFYIYDIPAGESRGAHAHLECQQFLVATSGSFDVLLDDGNTQRLVSLNQPFRGLYIPPFIWAQEQNFSAGSICLVLASHFFDESDYIRDYNQFINLRNGARR